MTHNMKLNPSPFEKISRGIKNVELRLYDEKRRKISSGDTIIFTDTTGRQLTKEVNKTRVFKNFEELYSEYDKTSLGYKEEEKASAKDMEKYYSLDKIDLYGVCAIELI